MDTERRNLCFQAWRESTKCISVHILQVQANYEVLIDVVYTRKRITLQAYVENGPCVVFELDCVIRDAFAQFICATIQLTLKYTATQLLWNLSGVGIWKFDRKAIPKIGSGVVASSLSLPSIHETTFRFHSKQERNDIKAKRLVGPMIVIKKGWHPPQRQNGRKVNSW